MRVGDLVKMRRGYSPAGLVVEIKERSPAGAGKWVRIMWPDYQEAPSLERARDVEVIDESR